MEKKPHDKHIGGVNMKLNGVSMGIIVLGIVAFVALIGAAFLYVGRENNDYAKLIDQLQSLGFSQQSLDAKISSVNGKITTIQTDLDHLNDKILRITERIDLSESKLNTASDLAYRANTRLSKVDTVKTPTQVTVDFAGRLPIRIIDQRQKTKQTKGIKK